MGHEHHHEHQGECCCHEHHHEHGLHRQLGIIVATVVLLIGAVVIEKTTALSEQAR